MNLGAAGRLTLKAVVSLLLGGVFYAAWLAAFLLLDRLENDQVERTLLILAPVVTAAGFAAGVCLVEKVGRMPRTGFLMSWVWALLGCAVGALAVYFYGPMLIVFTMLCGGTVAVVYRELTGSRSRRRHSL
jgi:Na+/H+-dicarboxylate symporter